MAQDGDAAAVGSSSPVATKQARSSTPVEQPLPTEPSLGERTEPHPPHDSDNIEETAQDFAGQGNSDHDQPPQVEPTSPAEPDHRAPPRRPIDWKSIKNMLKKQPVAKGNTGDPGSGSIPTALTSGDGEHGVSTAEDGTESEERSAAFISNNATAIKAATGHGKDGKSSTTPRKRVRKNPTAVANPLSDDEKDAPKRKRARKEQGGPSGRKSKAELITILKNCQRQKHGGITTLSTKSLQTYPAEFTREGYIRTDSAIMGLSRSKLGLTQAEYDRATKNWPKPLGSELPRFFTSDGHLRERSLADNAQTRDNANSKFRRTDAAKDTEEAAKSAASTVPTGAQNVVVEAIWKVIGNGQNITAETFGLQRMGKNIRSLVEFAQEKAKKDVLHERFMTKAFEKMKSQIKLWRKYARQWKTAYEAAERHIELQANAIEELKELIPEDQQEKLQEQDIPEWNTVDLKEPELPVIGQPLTEEDFTTDDKAAIKPSTSKVGVNCSYHG